MLPTLQRSYPDLQIELRETQTQRAARRARARRARRRHAGAAGGRPRHRDACALFDDPFLLAVPATDDALERRARIAARDIDHAPADPAGGGALPARSGAGVLLQCRAAATMGLGATSLATVMQMVANGYGVTLVPQVAVDVEVRDERVKLLRFAPPQPGRTVGLAWRRTSPRKADFVALGQLVDGSARLRRFTRPRGAALRRRLRVRARACPRCNSSRRAGSRPCASSSPAARG